MVPNHLTLMDFIALTEKIEFSNSIGFNTGDNLIIFGFASLLFN